MKVFFLTPGKHISEGSGACDGPLTEEAKKCLQAIDLSEVADADIYCGVMPRDVETATVIGVKANPNPSVGFDDAIFAALKGNTYAQMMFLGFLAELKVEGKEKVLLITSRFYPLLMQFIMRGGEKRLGVTFGQYIGIIEDMINWNDGTFIPLLEQCQLSQFDY